MGGERERPYSKANDLRVSEMLLTGEPEAWNVIHA